MPRFSGAPEVAASGDGRPEVFVFDFKIDGPLWHVCADPATCGAAARWLLPAGRASLAETRITAARLTSSVQNPGGGQYVARQTPGAGTVVAIGSTVELFVEKIAP